MTHFSKLALVLLVAFVLAACGSDSNPPGQAEEPTPTDDAAAAVPVGEWVLDFLLLEGDMAIPLPDRPVDLRIDGSEIGGSGGCNSIGGTTSFLGDGSVAIGDLFWTEMACEPRSIMDFEASYTAALLTVNAWTIEDDRLVLRGPTAELTYVPRVAPPDAPILGTAWTLDTFFDGEAATHEIGMEAVTVTFSEAGVSASGACWTISGFATIEPGGEGNLTVDFSTADPGFTCEDRGFFAEMMDRLSQVGEYSIDERRLTLSAGGQPIVGFVREN